MYRNLHNLAEVCSVWKDVAITEDQLWETLPAIDNPIKRNVINLSLERSRGRALCLAAKLPDDGAPPFLPDIVKDNAHRLRDLNVKGDLMKDIHRVLTAVLQAGVPCQLSELSLHCLKPNEGEPSCIVLPESLEHDAFSQLVISLSSLRLARVQIDWEATSFSNRLVEFVLHDVDIGDSDMAIFQLLSVLSTASELRDLKLMFVRARRGQFEGESLARSKPQFVFPNLQSLVLAGLYFSVMEFLLLAISPGSYYFALDIAPNAFKLQNAFWPTIIVNPDDLVALLSPFGVNSLVLYRGPLDKISPWLEGSDLRRIIQSMPVLKELIMIGWDFNADFCNGLVQGGWPGPELDALKLFESRASNEEALKTLLSSIPARKITLEGYVPTKRGRVELKDDDVMVKWLESHIPGFCLTDKNASQDTDYYTWLL